MTKGEALTEIEKTQARNEILSQQAEHAEEELEIIQGRLSAVNERILMAKTALGAFICMHGEDEPIHNACSECGKITYQHLEQSPEIKLAIMVRDILEEAGITIGCREGVKPAYQGDCPPSQ